MLQDGKFKCLTFELVCLNMNFFWEREIPLWVVFSPLFTWEVQFQVRPPFSEEAKTVTFYILCPPQQEFWEQQKQQSWGQGCEQPWDGFGGVPKEQCIFSDRISDLGRGKGSHDLLQPCHPNQSWALLNPLAVLSCGEGMWGVPACVCTGTYWD